MKVYIFQQSGNAYKVRILLGLLNVPYERVVLDNKNQEHKQAAYLKINPRGEVPAIEDDGKIIWDSGACLVYLARKHGGEKWLPTDPAGMAAVMQWMVLAATEIQCGLQYARRAVVMGRETLGPVDKAQEFGRKALAAMEGRLKGHQWLAADRPTIADVACFPYVNSAPEGKVALENYPSVIAWLERCKALPGWPPQ
ncbi:MAG TPA: glutathione S-transferase family protein [Burkholderiales bacterium]|jgi:glutathione S-transferase|nr:glutathione S-transferase family protein [Burkholderiales bacterium]